MLCDDLGFFNKPEIVIPYPTTVPAKRVRVVDIHSEERRKEFAIRVFQTVKHVCADEARYYLLLHDFDFKAALKEYEEDIAWEKHQDKKNKKRMARILAKLQNKKKKKSVLDALAQTIGLCFPGIRAMKPSARDDDVYGELELDELPDDL
jgi:hypothetical protein